MRNVTGFCLCENKGADQLCSNCTADQRLYFRYADSKIPLLRTDKISSLCFCDCTDRFFSDLVGNTKDRFSRVAAQIMVAHFDSFTSWKIHAFSQLVLFGFVKPRLFLLLVLQFLENKSQKAHNDCNMLSYLCTSRTSC